MFLIINILHFNNFVHIMGTEIWNRIIQEEKKNIYIYIYIYEKIKNINVDLNIVLQKIKQLK